MASLESLSKPPGCGHPGSHLETRALALLRKLHTSGQQPLSFGGKSRPGRIPSARAPNRVSGIAAALDGGMPPKKRPQPHHHHSHGHHHHSAHPASDNAGRSHAEPFSSKR